MTEETGGPPDSIPGVDKNSSTHGGTGADRAGTRHHGAGGATQGGTGPATGTSEDGGAAGALDENDPQGTSDSKPGDAGSSEEPNDAEPTVLALENCDLTAPFEAPVAAFTRSMNANGLTFSADGLTAYISGPGSTGGDDIYIATRSSTDVPFSAPTLFAPVNTNVTERSPSVSPDGKLYFTKTVNGWFDIGRATGSPFSGSEPVPNPISSSVQDEDPFWWNNQTLYFVSERPLGDHRDVWKATLNSGVFSAAKLAGPVNSAHEEYHPIVSPDGLKIYFGSRRHGIASDTSGDIWMADWDNATQQFTNVVNLWGLNSTGVDFPVTISSNGCTLYFASNEETGLGTSPNYRLYQATRGASTPSQVTLRLNILGQGSVNSGPFNCAAGNVGTCSASAAPGTTMLLWANTQAQWTGSCTGNSSNSSSDGIVTFATNAVCTVKFGNPTLVAPGGLCSLSMDCQAGFECTNNQCVCATGSTCSAQCPCGEGGICQNNSHCVTGLSCTGGTCRPNHCANQVKDADETDVDCGGSCAPCSGGKVCNAQTDCAGGLICETNNGACFGLARDERVCWPAQCTDGIDEGECGQANSPCGAFCGCGVPCNVGDPSSTCPAGEECIFDFGPVLGIPSRDACGPGGGICPSDDPALCGDELKLCGKYCLCVPDCSDATPANPSDGCGGLCPGVCPMGLRGCCKQDFECAGGGVCLTDPDGARTCRPSGPNGCDNRALKPPLCGTPNAPCGATCPTCTSQCGGRQCGRDPNCGASCGTCGPLEYCDSAGQCRAPALDVPLSVPDGNGGHVQLEDIPTAPASGVGATAGRFSVSEQGTAQYAIPIEVPPGRMGMTPALSLVYQASRDNGSLGVGWRLEGLSKITRCPKIHALEGYAAAVKNDATDAFCLDGKRLVTVPSAQGNEYRTLIDNFAKIVSHQEQGAGVQSDPPPGQTYISRSQQGPDSWEVRTKDGRILTYGGTLNSLVMGTVANGFGVRQAWLLRRIADRAGNTIDFSYDNIATNLAAVQMPDGRRSNIVHPSSISYTGHGNTLGNREVRFTYDTRPDPTLRFLQGGVAWALQHRLTRIATYVDNLAVKNYRLGYYAKDFSQIETVKECEGDADTRCKNPTRFRYEGHAGFEYVPAGISGNGQLDADGNGIPDYLSTEISVEGIDADPTLVAAQVAVDVAIGVGTSFLGPEIAIPVQLWWDVFGPVFWGAFAKRPRVTVEHFLSLGTGDRANPLNGVNTSGIPCDYANSFQDFDRDGRDDIVAACDSLDPDIRIAVSMGNGNFASVPSLNMPSIRSEENPTIEWMPIFYDADGDSLVDVLSCSDECTIEFRRRVNPGLPSNESFAAPIQWRPTCTVECSGGACQVNGEPEPFCTHRPFPRTHAIFDIDGDGTPDLLNSWMKYGEGGAIDQGWRVLRYGRDNLGEQHIEWKDVPFPKIDMSELGRHLQLADYNSDGLQDILYVQPTIRSLNLPPIEGRGAGIWLNTGTGSFIAKGLEHPVWGDRSLLRVAPADYNADGRMDWIEHWRDVWDESSCDSTTNVVLVPNSNLTFLTATEDPSDLRRDSNGCGTVPGAIEMMGDFDADGSIDLVGEDRAYYGRGKHTLLLTRIEDGLGNVTTVTYDGPGAYQNTCTGSTWPEQCLKRMSGLVSGHDDGVVLSDGTEVSQRKTRYKYENARVSATGHGWIGFDRRTVEEGPFATGGIITWPTPSDTESSSSTTTTVMEPVARYTLAGAPTTSTTPPYTYPLAGLPKTIDVDRTKAQSPLESAAYRRRTRIANTWRVGSSAASLAFPFVETRVSSVFEADVGAAAEGADGALLTACTETFVPDDYGNITDHEERCPAFERIHTVTTFNHDPGAWLISSPDLISVTGDRFGTSDQTQSWDLNYFSNGLLQSVERAPGGSPDSRHTTVYTRDAFGNMETATEIVPNALPRTTTITYDQDKIFPETVTNAKGHRASLKFNRHWGIPKTIVNPNGVAIRHGYDGLGLLTETRDPEGTTVYAYARTFREVPTQVGTTRPRISITTNRQGIDGTPVSPVFQELDNRGRSVLTTTIGFEGLLVTSARAYDENGRLNGVTLPTSTGETVVPGYVFSYDGFNRVKRITHLADQTSTEIQYASVITLAQSFGHWLDEGAQQCGDSEFGCAVEVEHSRDEEGKRDVVLKNHRGLVTRNIDGNNVATAELVSDYRYGAFNRLVDIRHNQPPTHPTGAPRSLFEYDPYGRLLSHSDPDSGPWTYTYNGFDALKTSLDPMSQLRTFNYDQLGRIREIVDPGNKRTEWIYDLGVNALGRISETISPSTDEAPLGQHILYTYENVTANNRGLLQRVDYQIDSTSYPISFTYDGLGRTDTISYPDYSDGPPIVTKYSYTPTGFLKELQEIGSGTTRSVWRMDEAFQGRLPRRETFGNGATTLYTYDLARRFLESIDTFFGSQTIQGLQYTHYDNGLVRDRISGFDTTTYFYDALNRLSSTRENQEESFNDYDHLGNLTLRHGVAQSYDLPTRPHLVTTVGGTNFYEYYPNGNLRRRVGTAIPSQSQFIEYTPFDLPSIIITGPIQNERVTRFEYSASEDRLVRRDRTPGVETVRHFATNLYQRFVHFGGDPDGSDAVEETFRVYAGSREVAQIIRKENGDETTLYFHADHLGTPETISTSDNQVIKQELDPWGRQDSFTQPTTITRTGFTGHEHDRDLGFVDMRGRVYDPLSGRFTTPDPIMQAPFWSQGLNRYAYTFNDPVNNTDPLGFDVKPLLGLSNGYGYEFSDDPLSAMRPYEFTDASELTATDPTAAPTEGPNILGISAAALNIINKWFDEQYIGMKSTPEASAVGSGGSKAPTATAPAEASPNAAFQSKPVGNMRILAELPEMPSGEPYDHIGEAAVIVTDLAGVSGVVKGGIKQGLRRAVRQTPRAGTREVIRASSRKLGKALEKAGHVRPDESAAHHIVAGKGRADIAAPARAVLDKFGIGINDASNGVFLPASATSANPTGAAVHASLHTNEYYTAVNEVLAQAGTREQALQALDMIRQRLLSGGFP